MQICWPLLFNMFDTLFCQWVRHIFRMMGLTAVFRSKSLGLMCFILCTGEPCVVIKTNLGLKVPKVYKKVKVK